MSIYVFSLLTNFKLSGVDIAQGRRNIFFHKAEKNAKYIFTDLPNQNDIQKYINCGIETSEMMSAHFFLAEKNDLSGNSSVSEKIDELKKTMEIDQIIETDDRINIYKNSKRVASILLKGNRDYFYTINYYSNEKLIVSEFYAERLLYVNFYVTAEKNGRLYAKLERTAFVDSNGTTVYECIYDIDGQELYLFTNGLILTKYQFLEEFIKKLDLTEEDMVLFDRPSYLPYVQPLFQYGSKAKFVVFMHSGHYYKKGETPYALYLNYEYYNWFKYSNYIDMILVSTEEQKLDLIEKLQEFNCYVPTIEVIPVSGLEDLKYPVKERKSNSILTVSRITKRKKIDWIIQAVIKAHNMVPDISLDIYGSGDDDFVSMLKEMVTLNNADAYIRFMGQCDVAEVFQNYEMYVTASLWETLGLSVMEAVGAGNALIGLNTRYGNKLFIHNQINGKLIDFDVEDEKNDEKVAVMIEKMAESIVEVFQDEEKLKQYHRKSYKIAEKFLNEKLEKKWINIIETLEIE